MILDALTQFIVIPVPPGRWLIAVSAASWREQYVGRKWSEQRLSQKTDTVPEKIRRPGSAWPVF